MHTGLTQLQGSTGHRIRTTALKVLCMTSVSPFCNSNPLTPATHMAASGFHSNVPNGYHSNKLKKRSASFGSGVDKLPAASRTCHYDYCKVNVRHSNWVTEQKSVLDIWIRA